MQIKDYDKKRLKKSLFFFYIKSKALLPFTTLSAYHGYDEKTIRNHFHRGRVLLWTFFTPYHFGVGHLKRSEILSKQSNWSSLINEVTGKNLIVLLDGVKIKQHRFTGNYNHSYNSYDNGKHYHTRGYMGIVTTSGYCIDLMGAFCTNGKHGDSHVWNWIVQNDHNGINSILDADNDILGVDRGWKFCINKSSYQLLMPTLCKDKPVPVFQANISRILTTLRWIVEAQYGQWKNRWCIFKITVHHQHRSYANSWHKNIAGTDNYLRPNGFIKDRDEDDVHRNLHIHRIKHELYANAIQSTVVELDNMHNSLIDSSEHNEWIHISEQDAKRLLPGIEHIQFLSDEDIKLFSGGNYGFEQRIGYNQHNATNPNLCLYVHGAQIRVDWWKQLNDIHKFDEKIQVARQQGRHYDVSKLKEERSKCADDACRSGWDYYILKVTGVKGRHQRKDDSKTTYSLYYAFDLKQYDEYLDDQKHNELIAQNLNIQPILPNLQNYANRLNNAPNTDSDDNDIDLNDTHSDAPPPPHASDDDDDILGNDVDIFRPFAHSSFRPSYSRNSDNLPTQNQAQSVQQQSTASNNEQLNATNPQSNVSFNSSMAASVQHEVNANPSNASNKSSNDKSEADDDDDTNNSNQRRSRRQQQNSSQLSNSQFNRRSNRQFSQISDSQHNRNHNRHSRNESNRNSHSQRNRNNNNSFNEEEESKNIEATDNKCNDDDDDDDDYDFYDDGNDNDEYDPLDDIKIDSDGELDENGADHQRIVDVQEKEIRELFKEEKLENIQCNDGLIPIRVRCIKSYCICPHGARTIGCCAHRTFGLQLLRNLFIGKDEEETHPRSRAQGNIAINIENGHQLRPTQIGQF